MTTRGVAKKVTTAKGDTRTPIPAGEQTASSAGSPVRIRMYRQGLGDCFLITLPGANGPFYMVIDCGVVLGTGPDGIQKLKDAVSDISTVTKGKIDLLVVTHEHYDHVSGFLQAQDTIGKWNVGQVWTAWTEDPKDPMANKLRAERKNTESALRLALNQLREVSAMDQANRVSSLLDFFGATSGTTATAFAYAKERAGKNLRFCQPGEPPIMLPELPRFRFYVLGPPRDEKLLRKSDPGKGEAYGLDDGSSASNAMFLNALSREASTDDVTLAPFESRFQIPLNRAQRLQFFDHHYFGDLQDGSLTEHKAAKKISDQSWRRIDSAWLDSSETLALALDSMTNNTSLVLAIEMIDTGEILLFPGDAQAGNWLSWQDLRWTEEDVKGKDIVTTGPDLLARTIFYKVGHHGSHNATLSQKGLELMTKNGLVTMIPVDHAMALKKRWGKMPLPDLVDRLNEQAHGRVLRIDDAATTPAQLREACPANSSADDWKAFTDRVSVTDLYFELSI